MLEFAALILSMGTVIFFVGVLLLGFRGLKIFEAYVNELGKREKDKPTQGGSHFPFAVSTKQESIQKPKEVTELPPEVLAPSIKKPPRSPGGFGSTVGNKNRASQIQQRNKASSTRSQENTAAESNKAAGGGTTDSSEISSETTDTEDKTQTKDSGKAKGG